MSAILNKIFVHHRRSLLGTVMRIVHDRHLAEDLAQETYIRARKAMDTGTVDHNRHRDMRNRFENSNLSDFERNDAVADTPSPEIQVIQCERLRLLEDALAKLPKRARTTWILSRVHKWSHKQIADHLGVSPNTVFNDLKKLLDIVTMRFPLLVVNKWRSVLGNQNFVRKEECEI